jgi:adenylylsulfate kinase
MEEVTTRHYPGAIAWFTGLSGAGKTTLCLAVLEQLRKRGIAVEMLDGDEMRRTVCAGLGFSREDREENVRRIAAVAEELAMKGALVLVAAIAPYRAMRQGVRERVSRFVEVYVNASLETCIERDTKGLYKRALAREIESFTGVSDPYEPPLAPEIECKTEFDSVEVSVAVLIATLGRILQLEEDSVYAHR